MAIQLKELIAQGFLELCENKPLKAITIRDLILKTGISRQSFYNHFMNRLNTIPVILNEKTIADFGWIPLMEAFGRLAIVVY